MLAIPTPGAPNRAAPLGDASRLRVNEWLANPASGDDWFEIHNPNLEPVSLAGLDLADSLNSLARHRLPNLSFIGTGSRGFIRFLADNNPSAGAAHLDFALSASGEAVVLTDSRGTVIDAISFGPQSRGVSEGRLPDGGVARVFFPFSASPGAANFLPLDHVVINEVLTHSDPPLEDAVEIYNLTPSPVDISGWYLSDSPLNPRKFQIPQNTIVSGEGFLVFYEYQFNGDDIAEPFALNSSAGEEIFLSEVNDGVLTGYRASARFGAARGGVSFGRIQTSQGPHFVPLGARTFGQDNPATVEIFRMGRGASNAAPLIGPVVITEIMYNPSGVDQPFEFVELRNVGASPVNLFDPLAPENTWRLTGGIELQFPGGLTLAAGEFILAVGFDPLSDASALAAFRQAYGLAGRLVGPFQGALSNSGETLDLQQPDLPDPATLEISYFTVDRVDYGDEAPWPLVNEAAHQSLQKPVETSYGNDPVNWVAAAPTAGGPLLPAHGLQLAIEIAGNSDVTLQFTALAGKAYQLLATGSLNDAWAILTEIPAGPDGRRETISIQPQNRAAFFKLRLLGE
jgi:hypothetical protein